jgi:hypothetical protein
VQLLSKVFERLVVGPDGIDRMIMRRPFDTLGRQAVA